LKTFWFGKCFIILWNIIYSMDISKFQSGISASFDVMDNFIQRNCHSRQCNQSQPSFYLYHCTSCKSPAGGNCFESIFTITVCNAYKLDHNFNSRRDPTLELWNTHRVYIVQQYNKNIANQNNFSVGGNALQKYRIAVMYYLYQ
jgi:hypothetical protein